MASTGQLTDETDPTDTQLQVTKMTSSEASQSYFSCVLQENLSPTWDAND